MCNYNWTDYGLYTETLLQNLYRIVIHVNIQARVFTNLILTLVLNSGCVCCDVIQFRGGPPFYTNYKLWNIYSRMLMGKVAECFYYEIITVNVSRHIQIERWGGGGVLSICRIFLKTLVKHWSTFGSITYINYLTYTTWYRPSYERTKEGVGIPIMRNVVYFRTIYIGKCFSLII